MASLTNRILNSIQKLGCDCSATCKGCSHFDVPAATDPCRECKYGSLSGKKDNFSKASSAKSTLAKKSRPDKEKEVPEESKESDMSYGGSGNVSNTPPSKGEKRAWDKKAFLETLIRGLGNVRK